MRRNRTAPDGTRFRLLLPLLYDASVEIMFSAAETKKLFFTDEDKLGVLRIKRGTPVCACDVRLKYSIIYARRRGWRGGAGRIGGGAAGSGPIVGYFVPDVAPDLMHSKNRQSKPAN